MQLSSIENCFPAARFPWSTAYAMTSNLKAAMYDALGEPLSDMIDNCLQTMLVTITIFITSVGSNMTMADWSELDNGSWLAFVVVCFLIAGFHNIGRLKKRFKDKKTNHNYIWHITCKKE